MSPTSCLPYLARLLLRLPSSGDIEAVYVGGGRGTPEVVGAELDVVESVIVQVVEGVPAVVGEGGGGATVTHHHPPGPTLHLALRLKLEIRIISILDIDFLR